MAKQAMIEDMAKTEIARDILIEGGVLERCPVHEDCIIELCGLESGYEYAEYLARKRQIPNDFSSLEDLLHYVELAYQEYAGIECPMCGE